jgi:phosphatidylserine synthase
VGLPASVSTIIIVGLGILDVQFYVFLLVLFLLSIAMISSVPFPKPDIYMNTAASLLIIISLVLYTSLYNAAFILILIASVFYSITGPLYLKKTGKKNG